MRLKVSAILVMGLSMLGLIVMPGLSRADFSIGIGVGDDHHDHWDHHYYGWHDRPSWGYHVHYLPAGYYTIWVGGSRYFYYDGLYYRDIGGGEYIVVDPPVGAYVSAIPPDFQAINVNGRIYYTNGGVYYILTRHHGYKVVMAPVVMQPAPVVTTVVEPPPVAPPAQDSFTINVPMSNGSYTPVVIKRSGAGYAGPQGEYYPTFPSVAQLKAMYGK